MRLKDLAEHLGLSQTTVSRALNGYPEVNEATRRRVAETAARLGYRPNASALRLATGRSGASGLVLRGADDLGPHMSEFLAGMGGHVGAQEIDILVVTVNSLEEEMANSVEYDIVPDYDRLLDIMSAAKRTASGG